MDQRCFLYRVLPRPAKDQVLVFQEFSKFLRSNLDNYDCVIVHGICGAKRIWFVPVNEGKRARPPYELAGFCMQAGGCNER